MHERYWNSFGEIALRWYAKRPKLYSAFQRFIIQEAELQNMRDSDEFIQMAHYFALRIENYDFWNDMEMWKIVEYYGEALKKFISNGRPYLINTKFKELENIQDLVNDDILELWRCLTLMARTYEDINREWFLPTALSYKCTYHQ